ncbi:hypothetical protein [Rhodococcus gannanensis]|uniref:DUF4190 domain-containing protein n=1 Tax=Rhodococcus gannanensis TaxID=1960308 RepID=A0ABW4P1V6_9NOCA
MTDDPQPIRPETRNGAGSTAFIAGIIAAVFAFIPFIGEFVAIPAGLIAVVGGWIGLDRVDRGVATNRRDALIGAGLGIAALFVVFLVFAATYDAT